MEDVQNLLIEMVRLADRVTMARLGLLHEVTVEDGDIKKTTVHYTQEHIEVWEKYPAYFRQTLAYLAASVRDGYATLDAPARPVDLE